MKQPYNGRVNIYIKQSDRAKWDAIDDKPAFIHDAIHVQHSLFKGTMYPKKEVKLDISNVPLVKNPLKPL